ncbi:MAG: hypothetical protein LC774_16610, partial [Acidobacteria bacterium]|nr:hypothetical protein [Acidobacteriota bacterium]
RLNLFELALLKSERARELEAAAAARMEAEGDAPYVRGDLFCFRDYAHFIVFGDADGGAAGVRAGIVYETETADPAQKLEEFCQNVADSLRLAAGGGGAAGEGANGSGAAGVGEWRARDSNVPESFARFAADEGAPLLATRGEMVEGWLRAAGMLEDSEARRWLSRLHNSHQDGRSPSLRDGEGGESVPEPLLRRFTEAGLVRREILVSCRKAGRALFRLPSPDALAVLGNAVCSECGASVGDEQAEEVVVPTSLTTTLLQDSSWLATHLRAILSKLGLTEAQIAARQAAAGDSDVQMMANVCGEPFLFLLRDGDWTAAHARRAAVRVAEDDEVRVVAEAEQIAAHVGRVALRLHGACERALGRELWELDASLGMSVGYMMAARARLLHGEGELRDVAASAASAVAGSLAEL